MKVEMGKEYRLRNGCEYRMYCDDAGDDWAIHGAFKRDSTWTAIVHRADGSAGCSGTTTPYDLIEVKPRIVRSVWANVYPEGFDNRTHDSRHVANSMAGAARIACIRIDLDIEHGAGLDGKEVVVRAVQEPTK